MLFPAVLGTVDDNETVVVVAAVVDNGAVTASVGNDEAIAAAYLDAAEGHTPKTYELCYNGPILKLLYSSHLAAPRSSPPSPCSTSTRAQTSSLKSTRTWS